MLRSSAVAIVCVMLFGCPPRGGFMAPGTQPAGGGAATPPPPPVDNRNAGQVVVDIMTQQGYQCAMEETRWQCSGGNTNGWPLYISYVDTNNPITIWIDSFDARAFARQCPQFTDAMKDLTNGTDFMVSCDDGSQQFRFNTYVSYGADLDVMGWVHKHEEVRANAVKLLDSIQAIRH